MLTTVTSLVTDAFMRGYSNENTVATYECNISDTYHQTFGVDLIFDKNVTITVKHNNSIHGYNGKRDEIFITDSGCAKQYP